MIFFRENKTPTPTLSPLHIRIDIKALVEQKKNKTPISNLMKVIRKHVLPRNLTFHVTIISKPMISLQ